MRAIILTISFYFLVAITFGQSVSKPDLKYTPKNLEEAVLQLERIHHDTTKQRILEMTEDLFTGHSHFGLGMWIRNNWKLWKGGELAKYFNSIGIFHPDDMSGIILTSYYRHLKGQERALDKQVKYYQDYWKASSEHIERLKKDTSYQRQVQQKQDSLKSARLNEKKLKWTEGKLVSGYLSYQCGLLDMGNRTRILGNIIEWRDDKLIIQVTQYFDQRKKKKAIKCNQVKKDIVIIDNIDMFNLVE